MSLTLCRTSTIAKAMVAIEDAAQAVFLLEDELTPAEHNKVCDHLEAAYLDLEKKLVQVSTSDPNEVR